MATATYHPQPKIDPIEAKKYFEQAMKFTTGPVELSRELESDAIHIIDVRAAEDYQKGHVPGAYNLPQDKWNSLETLSKDKTNVLYCYSGVCHLAKKAALEFAGAGYPVMELDGGFDEWQAHDLPVEK
ncbi:MAG: rhodanese-like domain-containing protein [Vampirovibrionales bacterium]|nr:rhodanese-like domain-containing protein [Vampirovibrionales bacterium]